EYWIVDDTVRGWTNGPDRWQPLGYLFSGAYRPSDMARLPSGDMVVLERAYNPDRGIVGVRLRRVSRKGVKAGAKLQSTLIAELAPPLSVDNFEGIDAVRGQNGETLIYIVSDNNFRTGDQRTLLLMFALDQ
ncbi:MAG TPA: esterase-like activity of phytase family protein, partial [Vicinamibacteria bacterium]